MVFFLLVFLRFSIRTKFKIYFVWVFFSIDITIRVGIFLCLILMDSVILYEKKFIDG